MVNVTVDPLTRIEGHQRINTEVDANGVITDAQSSSLISGVLNGFCRTRTQETQLFLPREFVGYVLLIMDWQLQMLLMIFMA